MEPEMDEQTDVEVEKVIWFRKYRKIILTKSQIISLRKVSIH